MNRQKIIRALVFGAGGGLLGFGVAMLYIQFGST
jgi:hypothetical protein